MDPPQVMSNKCKLTFLFAKELLSYGTEIMLSSDSKFDFDLLTPESIEGFLVNEQNMCQVSSLYVEKY